jgi:protein phosphatase
MARHGSKARGKAKKKAAKRRRVAGKREAVNLGEMHGPFDIVGDVHGCLDELLALLRALNYAIEQRGEDFCVTPPPGRTLAFAGDLVDRGPAAPGVLRLAMGMAHAGTALCVAGNRDVELVRALRGHAAKVTRGMARTLDQLAAEPESFRAEAQRFLRSRPSHLVLDEHRLVLAHAGLKEAMQGRTSAAARAFALHGDVTGERDAAGLAVRRNWAAEYRGKALVVHGHTPASEATWLNNTVNIDTGCVYGGHLTALRYPERETVSIPAQAIYYAPRRRFAPNPVLDRKRK